MQAKPDSTEEPLDLPEHLKVNGKGLPGKVFHLRQKLYLKAKREPGFRFYTLYEAVCRTDVLQAAWDRVAANDGAPGVDNVSIEAVQNSEHGVSGFLSEIQQSLKDRTLNREKTRTVNLNEPGASLDFLGYTFRYDRDLQGRNHRYLNMCPSEKTMQRERDKLREMTGPERCFMPIPALIDQINVHLRGWSNYFSRGYPRHAFRQINRYVQERLERHLKRRSQRPFRVTGVLSWYAQLHQLGLRPR